MKTCSDSEPHSPWRMPPGFSWNLNVATLKALKISTKNTSTSRMSASYLEVFLAALLLLQTHPFFVLLDVASFSGLQVEPGVGEGLDQRQEGIDKGMEVILECKKTRKITELFISEQKTLTDVFTITLQRKGWIGRQRNATDPEWLTRWNHKEM